MLKQRIITASILAIFIVTAIFLFDPIWFLAIFSLFILVGVWEWIEFFRVGNKLRYSLYLFNLIFILIALIIFSEQINVLEIFPLTYYLKDLLFYCLFFNIVILLVIVPAQIILYQNRQKSLISKLSLLNLPVGISDHSPGDLVSIASVALGATIIEKHITFDRSLKGPDHSFALDPSELELMINSVRSAEKTFGSGKKEILADEEELHKFATRSIQAISDISRGDVLQEGKNFDILRPGNRIRGIDARFLSKINGKKSTKNIASGDGITDYE